MSTNQAQREALARVAASLPFLRAFRDFIESAASRNGDANDSSKVEWIFDLDETLRELDGLVKAIEHLVESGDSGSNEGPGVAWEQIEWEEVLRIITAVIDILSLLDKLQF